jgi:WD40 repeat protein
MKLISPTDIALLRRLPRMIAAVVIAGLWLAGMWFLYSASPYVPRWTTTSAHPGRTWVEFADGGKTLVVGTRRDGVLTLWDVATRRPRHVIEHPAGRELQALHVETEGKFVRAWYAGGEIEIREAATGKLVLKLRDVDQLSWSHIVMASDAKHFAMIPVDQREPILYAPVPDDPQAFDEGSKIDLPTLRGQPAETVMFAPDGQRFLAVFIDDSRTVEFVVVDSASGLPLSRVVQGHPAAWSPDGRRVVVGKRTALGKSSLAVLDTAASSETVLKLPAVDIHPVGFQSDNNTLVLVEFSSASRAPVAVRLWDITSQETWIAGALPDEWRWSYFVEGRQTAVAFCRQSNPLWERVLRWMGRGENESVETQTLLYDLRGTRGVTVLPDNTLLVADDGQAAASIDRDSGEIAVWDIPPRRNWMRLSGLAGLVAVPIVLLLLRRRGRSRS